jgi:alpha-ribazole phosphatase
MRLFLVRHGQTSANESGLFYGSTDLPLTGRGIEQGQQVGGYLAALTFGQIHTSQLQRAQQTARLVVPNGILTNSDPRLNEMHFGSWEMRHHSSIAEEDPKAWQRWVDDWQNVTPGGGEPFSGFAERVKNVADELQQQQDDGDILVVAHQGVLSLMLAHWLKMPVEAMWHFPFQQGAWTMVENRGGFMVLRHFNHQSPFRSEQ